MHLGLIVGIGPAATDFYYRSLIEISRQSGTRLELTMAHADAATLLRHQADRNIRAQVEIYRGLAGRLRAAGAEIIAITSIAGHFCIEEFNAISPLPVIDLLVEVQRELAGRRLGRVGLLGTRGVMETRFYGAMHGIEVIPPPPAELAAVHEAYAAMATTGTVNESQRQIFFAAGTNLVRNSAVEAVMLAGTDLNLAFRGANPGFATIDCAAIHAAAIARTIAR